jgi:ketosteroid isomerase-like protein
MILIMSSHSCYVKGFAMSEHTDRNGPREVFERTLQQWLGKAEDTDLLMLADNAVIETPFAPPGRPKRFEGREEFLAFAKPQRAALPVRFEEVRNVTIHDTVDPEVIVVEYELAGMVTATGRRAAAPFIAVLRVRDGKTVHWREYQNVPAMAEALGQLPALLAAYGEPDPETQPPGTPGS